MFDESNYVVSDNITPNSMQGVLARIIAPNVPN